MGYIVCYLVKGWVMIVSDSRARDVMVGVTVVSTMFWGLNIATLWNLANGALIAMGSELRISEEVFIYIALVSGIIFTFFLMVNIQYMKDPGETSKLEGIRIIQRNTFVYAAISFIVFWVSVPLSV